VLLESVLAAVVPSADYVDKDDGEISADAEVTETSPKTRKTTTKIASRPAPWGSKGRASFKGDSAK
jgi:hypothetical protein